VTYTETDLVGAIERLAGADLTALTQPQRDQFDQFHSGGSEAVDRLLPSLHLAPGMTVLDVGSGLGGPARQIARSSGCTVLGVDITPAYVDTAQALTRTAGLENQVSFVCSDITALDRNDFDAAYTMHVQMNVVDKKTFFTRSPGDCGPGRALQPSRSASPATLNQPHPCRGRSTAPTATSPQPTSYATRSPPVASRPSSGSTRPVGTSMVRGPRQTHSVRRQRRYSPRTAERRTDAHDELRRRPHHWRRVSTAWLVHPA
jgi:SAM-dependent methyltransferase